MEVDAVEAAACAVGRLGEGGPWIGFAPSLDDGYDLVVASSGADRAAANDLDLLALAIAYFEDSLAPPPDDLAATHGDIGALVRHLAGRRTRRVEADGLDEAVDAIDDGLAADVVISRLRSTVGAGFDPVQHLAGRAAALRTASA